MLLKLLYQSIPPRSKSIAKKQQSTTLKRKAPLTKQQSTMTAFAMFLFCIFLIIFAAHTMAWIMSFFYSTPDNYTNPYRLVPREESETYKRYERQQYLDSFRR